MADSDYTLAVILQASDEGMSSTIKKTSNEVGNLGDKSKDTQLDLMATVVALEGLTSGLNQVTGGMRKYSAAMTETGLINEDQQKHFNKHIAYLELVTGPLETVIALQKIATIVSGSETMARIGEIGIKEKLMIVNNSLMASMLVWFVIIVAIIGVLALLYHAWKNQEQIMEWVSKQVDKVTGGFRGMVQSGREVSHTLQEIASGAGEAMEPLQRIISIIPGMGGD